MIRGTAAMEADHEIIMETVAEQISDGKVLGLIKKFLKSGVMKSGSFESTEIGSCQGGVISPLISSIYLNRFDQKMKEKGIRIVRFADDILIFAKDQQTIGNYKSYAIKVLEEVLKLKVNNEKTKLVNVREGVAFLGFIIREKTLSIHPKRLKRFKDRVRGMTKRNTGRKLEEIIKDLNPVIRGWMNYYKVANIKSLASNLMSWIRRRLRMLKMKQWKTYKAMHKEMRKQGIKGTGEKMAVWKWKNSNVHIIHQLLPNKFFNDLGLVDLGKYEVGLLSNYY